MRLFKHDYAYFFVALLFSISNTTTAQVEGPIKLQFVTFPAYTGEPIELYMGEDENIPIELPSTGLSRVYTLEKIPNCILGRTTTNDAGDTSFEKFGQTAPLTSNEQIILVKREGKDASEGLTLIPFSNDSSGFSSGKYLIMNASRVDIAGQIGKDKFLIKPNNHTMLDPEPSRSEGGRDYLYVKIYFRKGDSAHNFYSNIWRFSERSRSMVFIYHDPNTKQLRTQTIRNYPQS